MSYAAYHPLNFYFVASDVDASNLTRAESCDSIASDSSVLEMAPEMPKIGQLEFALEYDRCLIHFK